MPLNGDVSGVEMFAVGVALGTYSSAQGAQESPAPARRRVGRPAIIELLSFHIKEVDKHIIQCSAPVAKRVSIVGLDVE